MTMKSYSEDMARTTQTRERQSRMSCVVDEPDTCEDSDDTHASLYTEGGAKVRNECGVEQVSEGSNRTSILGSFDHPREVHTGELASSLRTPNAHTQQYCHN
jgi:hypothetical protein